MMTIRLILNFFTFILPFLAFGQSALDIFGQAVGVETLLAEQILSSTVPQGSDPIHSKFAQFFKKTGMTGTIPAPYTPKTSEAFSIVTVLIPADQADVLYVDSVEAETRTNVVVEIAGKTYYRLFVHPLEMDHWKDKYPDAPKDPIEWLATPSSSSRSLYVIDKERKSPVFIAKTSLNYTLAGGNRRVSRVRAERAVHVSSIYRDMMAETHGRIPNTNKTWSYFSESISIGAKGNVDEFTIMRGMPDDYKDVIYLPFFALIAERENQDRWIDELFRASGYTDKLAFSWNEIAKPMLEFEAMIHMDYGLISELHQQNAMLKVDPKTKKIIGFATRDMDGQSVDFAARKYLMGKSTLLGGLSKHTDWLFGYYYAKISPMLGYEYMKDSIFKHIFTFFLTQEEVARVVGGGNAFMLNRFNSKYERFIGKTIRFLDLKKSFQKLYDQKLSAKEKLFFAAREREENSHGSHWYRWASKAQFKYYALKQHLERTGDAPDDVEPVAKGQDPRSKVLLEEIRAEAAGLVPAEALEHWISVQSAGMSEFRTSLSLSDSDRVFLMELLSKVPAKATALAVKIREMLDSGSASTAQMRSISLEYAEAMDEKLRASGELKKVEPDFYDDIEHVKSLYSSTNPYWRTFKKLSPAEFVGLLALPIHIVGVADQMSYADALEMSPKEFLFHDEIHALGQMGAEEKYLKEKGIKPGTPEYYEVVLERVRFTAAFVRWSKTIPDPVARQIVSVLWFEAFHEYLPTQLPSGRGFYRTNYVSSEGLQKYLSIYLTKDGRLTVLEKMRLRFSWMERMRTTYGVSIFKRFVPGDHLAPDSTKSDQFTVDRILESMRLMSSFAKSTYDTGAVSCQKVFGL